MTTKLDRVIRHLDNVTSRTSSRRSKSRPEGGGNGACEARTLFVEAADQDLYAALDAMTDKLDRQVPRHKQKNQDHGHDAIKHRNTAEES